MGLRQRTKNKERHYTELCTAAVAFLSWDYTA
jgi:hypothetical protein